MTPDPGPSATTVWTAIASSAAVSALVSALIQLVAKYYFDARLERDKMQLSAEVNKLTAEQTRVTNRLQTVFSTLQTERAQAIKELYTRIVRVESILNFMATARAITDESAALYGDLVQEFVEYYLPNRIWLPSSVSDQTNELRSTFFSLQKAIASARHDAPISAEFRQGLVVVKGATARTLEEVSASFRELLGAETVA